MITSLLLLLAPSIRCTANDLSSAQHTLKIDPRLIAEAREVWTALGSKQQDIWPGWDASTTPLLFYFPGEQDLLIGHPNPPAGFERYRGELSFGSSEIWIRDGETIFETDGQNTMRNVAGTTTLVVADSLSNFRNTLRILLGDPPTGVRLEESLGLAALASDPYDQMGMIAHEAFHVFQSKFPAGPTYSEADILEYPVLSIENNVGLALEAIALDRALLALEEEDMSLFEETALQWLAARSDRRSHIPAKAAAYEDGIEFIEGTAKYIEYALTLAMEGQKAGAGMEWVRGFRGYKDLGHVRAGLRLNMRTTLNGEKIINGDPYGTAPVRFRSYYSGMAIGVMLDTLYPEWKQEIGRDERSLTMMMTESLYAQPEELADALALLRESVNYKELVAQKTELQSAGKEAALERVAKITSGAGDRVWIDYGALETSNIGWGYTPFGVTIVDANRKIYGQVPVSASFAGGSQLKQSFASPVLHDSARKTICFQVDGSIQAENLRSTLGRSACDGELVEDKTIELAGSQFHLQKGRIHLKAGELRIELLP